MRRIIPYNPKLKSFAKQLRNQSTRSEIKLWNHLKNKQFHGYRFHRQKPLLNFIADFYCYELKLIIELDGYTHQFEETIIKDELKAIKLDRYGLTVVRFTDNEVMNKLDGVMDELRKYISADLKP
jgi:very-short-patch-repair endonuclease